MTHSGGRPRKKEYDEMMVPMSISVKGWLKKLWVEDPNRPEVNSEISSLLEARYTLEDEDKEIKWIDNELESLHSKETVLLARRAYAVKIRDAKKELKMKAKIEENCDAWYLKDLVDRKAIRPYQPLKISDLYKDWKKRDPKSVEYLYEKDGEIYFTDVAPETTRISVGYGRMIIGNKITDIPKELSMSDEEIQKSLHIKLNSKKILDDFISITDIQDMAVDFFKRYDPKITSRDTKEETKKKMLQEYVPPEIKIEDKRDVE